MASYNISRIFGILNKELANYRTQLADQLLYPSFKSLEEAIAKTTRGVEALEKNLSSKKPLPEMVFDKKSYLLTTKEHEQVLNLLVKQYTELQKLQPQFAQLEKEAQETVTFRVYFGFGQTSGFSHNRLPMFIVPEQGGDYHVFTVYDKGDEEQFKTIASNLSLDKILIKAADKILIKSAEGKNANIFLNIDLFRVNNPENYPLIETVIPIIAQKYRSMHLLDHSKSKEPEE